MRHHAWVGLLILVACAVSFGQAMEPAAEKPAPAWKSEAELGFSGSRGNTSSDDLRAAVTSKMQAERNRISLDAKFSQSSADGEETRNDFTAGIVHDWLMPGSPWFVFAQGRYDHDEFQSWDHRFSAHAGPGYELVRTSVLDLTVRAGAGATEALNDDKAAEFEGQFEAEVTWRVAKGVELGGKSTYYPSLSGNSFGSPYRWVNSAYCKMRLAGFETMSVKFGVEDEYESDVPAGDRRHDSKLFASVVVAF